MNKDDYIPPYSKQFAYRVNKIKEMREQLNAVHKNDLLLARENGRLLTVSADESKLFHGNRTFGLVRPLSVGRNRDSSLSSTNSISDSRSVQSDGRNRRSQSVERFRGRSDSSVNTSTSLTSRNAIEFNKALQLNRDIAAEQKLRESLLQVKKEAYVKYLRAKIDHRKPNWIPSGDGAKHTESMHTSINRAGLEKSLVQKAWRRSPWPGLVTAASLQQATALKNTSMDLNTSVDSINRDENIHNSKLSPNKRALHIEVNHEDYEVDELRRQTPSSSAVQQINTTHHHVLSSPTSGGGHLRVRAMSYDPSPERREPPSPMSTRHAISNSQALRGSDSNTSLLSGASTTSPLRKRRSISSGNLFPTPAHVALTVRLINASKSSSSSSAVAASSNSYGILAVRASCSRAEFIGAIERQFGVFDQISDVSVASKYGYSGVLSFTSLSLGTLGERVELNDSSEVNVYLGGTLYQEGDNKDFLHFLEDELTHYEGKYSSYTQYNAGSGVTQGKIQTHGASARRRPNESESDRSVEASTPRSTRDRLMGTRNMENETVRVTSGRTASPRAMATQGTSLRQAQLQQHVQSLGINRQFELQTENDSSVASPQRLHRFSSSTTQLPVPYNVTHSFENNSNYNSYDDSAEVYDENLSQADTFESAYRYPQEESYVTEGAGNDEKRYEPATSENVEYLEGNNYFNAGVRPQYSDDPLHETIAPSRVNRSDVDFTIADLMPSVQKVDPLTAAQRAFLSPAGKTSSYSPLTDDRFDTTQDLTTPMPSNRNHSYHHPVDTSIPPSTQSSSSRRSTTRAAAIHEKILHRVATPTYKKPSTSDYSFQSAETTEALTRSRRGHSIADMKTIPVQQTAHPQDEDDDSYLLRKALSVKTVTPPLDRVAQFNYSALVSPSLLASSFHIPRVDTARHLTGNNINKDNKTDSLSSRSFDRMDAQQAVVTPPDLVLNSYVQSILHEGGSEDTTPEYSTENASTSIDKADSEVSLRPSSRPLADVFKSALGVSETNNNILSKINRGMSREGSLTIETASPALNSSDLRGSRDSDELSSTYGSIVMSPSASPMPSKSHTLVVPERRPIEEQQQLQQEPERHMESALLEYLSGQDSNQRQTSSLAAAPPDERDRKDTTGIVQEEGAAPRSAVVTSFLEKVQMRRLAKQQQQQQIQQQTVPMQTERDQPPVRKAVIQESFINLADLMK